MDFSEKLKNVNIKIIYPGGFDGHIKNHLKNKSNTDLLALDIRYALDNLGQITGEVTNDEILGNIFSKFCIGKWKGTYLIYSLIINYFNFIC